MLKNTSGEEKERAIFSVFFNSNMQTVENIYESLYMALIYTDMW